MVIVPKKLTKEMIEATSGFCWMSNDDNRDETIQAMWDAMLKAGEQLALKEQGSVFKLGWRYGREEYQEELQELLGIHKLIDDAMDNL